LVGLRDWQAYSPWAKSDLQSVLINKVLLEHNHTNLFIYCLWLLLCYLWQGLVVETETIWPTEPKLFITWCFTQKFFNPWLRSFSRLNMTPVQSSLQVIIQCFHWREVFKFLLRQYWDWSQGLMSAMEVSTIEFHPKPHFLILKETLLKNRRLEIGRYPLC
jgi:hypothetical protein